MEIIKDKTFDEERALYHTIGAEIENCTFAGPVDGESVLKEAREIHVDHCRFSLRYPLWHVDHFTLSHSSLDELTRAPIWYAKNGIITHTTIESIKAIRECEHITVKDCQIVSDEFGWKSRDIDLEDSTITSQYIFFDSTDVTLRNVQMKGKYSFQYMENLTIENCDLDTKDAFWHSKNVTVRNSTVKGEYLAWFSDGLTLDHCTIIGTQPLCYCRNLTLIDCTMIDTDLAFEYSDVQATVLSSIDSVKNPRSGKITAQSIGQIIREGSIMEDTCQIITQQ